MTVTMSLREVARKVLERHWRRRRRVVHGGPDNAASMRTASSATRADAHRANGASRAADPCPFVWLVDDLVRLISDAHDRPVSRLQPMIRRLVLERHFIGNVQASGVATASASADIDGLVRMIVHALEHVRRIALRRGHWSEVPATPLMFG